MKETGNGDERVWQDWKPSADDSVLNKRCFPTVPTREETSSHVASSVSCPALSTNDLLPTGQTNSARVERDKRERRTNVCVE